ncbi:PREDICTED: uncharacterized protein LOC109154288 [Ipomoea nil]|uniref:uncharacterized protein LOC109154288 n=1 Tax=Ipomoea nil TaxID=35883 RepID=UPI000900F65B|nr:PREDICTED: uncharacterized protein LOC109154288 [Ipomoea nil]
MDGPQKDVAIRDDMPYFTTAKVEKLKASSIFDRASEIWSALSKRYSQADPHRIAELQNEIFTTVQGVLVMDPIPDIEKVLNMTLKIERKINGTINQKSTELIQSNVIQTSEDQHIDEQGIIAFSASNNKKKFNNGGRNVPKCTYCNMTGHTVEKCYKKHGYPTRWIAGKSRNKQTQDAHNSSVNQVGDIGMNAEQFQRLVNLLQNQNQASQSTTNVVVTMNNNGESNEGRFISNLHVNNAVDTIWILDSGATDHIACSLEYFENCYKVHGLSVK